MSVKFFRNSRTKIQGTVAPSNYVSTSVCKNSSSIARKSLRRERAATGLIKLRPRAEVQLRGSEQRAKGTKSSLGTKRAIVRIASLVTMSLVTHKSPRTACAPAKPSERTRREAEKEERVRAFGISQSPQREVSAVTFIGYKSSRYYAEPE